MSVATVHPQPHQNNVVYANCKDCGRVNEMDKFVPKTNFLCATHENRNYNICEVCMDRLLEGCPECGQNEAREEYRYSHSAVRTFHVFQRWRYALPCKVFTTFAIIGGGCVIAAYAKGCF
jgi:hypothetical protein